MFFNLLSTNGTSTSEEAKTKRKEALANALAKRKKLAQQITTTQRDFFNLIIILDRDGIENNSNKTSMFSKFTLALKTKNDACILVDHNIVLKFIKDCRYIDKDAIKKWSIYNISVNKNNSAFWFFVPNSNNDVINKCKNAKWETCHYKVFPKMCSDQTKDVISALESTINVLSTQQVGKASPYWTIYLAGHGNKESSIANLQTKELQNFLSLLVTYDETQTIKMNMFFVVSCHVGGINQKYFHSFLDTNKDVLPRFFNFLIVLGGMEESSTFAEQNFSFDEFFEKAKALRTGDITVKSKKDPMIDFLEYRAQTQEVTLADPHAQANMPLVLMPGGIRFDAMTIKNVVATIGNVAYTREKLREKLSGGQSGFLAIENARVMFVYPTYLDIPIQIYPSMLSDDIVKGKIVMLNSLDQPLYYLSKKLKTDRLKEIKTISSWIEKINSAIFVTSFDANTINNWKEQLKNFSVKDNRTILEQRSRKMRYPAYVPQDKNCSLFFIKQVDVKYDPNKFDSKFKNLPPLGVINFIHECFLWNEYFEEQRTVLIEKLVGANDLFNNLILTHYDLKKTNGPFPFNPDDVTDPDKNITLNNVKIEHFKTKEMVVSFEFNNAKWQFDNKMVDEKIATKRNWLFSCTTNVDDVAQYTKQFERDKFECLVNDPSKKNSPEIKTILEDNKITFEDIIELMPILIEKAKSGFGAMIFEKISSLGSWDQLVEANEYQALQLWTAAFVGGLQTQEHIDRLVNEKGRFKFHLLTGMGNIIKALSDTRPLIPLFHIIKKAYKALTEPFSKTGEMRSSVTDILEFYIAKLGWEVQENIFNLAKDLALDENIPYSYRLFYAFINRKIFQDEILEFVEKNSERYERYKEEEYREKIKFQIELSKDEQKDVQENLKRKQKSSQEMFAEPLNIEEKPEPALDILKQSTNPKKIKLAAISFEKESWDNTVIDQVFELLPDNADVFWHNLNDDNIIIKVFDYVNKLKFDKEDENKEMCRVHFYRTLIRKGKKQQDIFDIAKQLISQPDTFWIARDLSETFLEENKYYSQIQSLTNSISDENQKKSFEQLLEDKKKSVTALTKIKEATAFIDTVKAIFAEKEVQEKPADELTKYLMNKIDTKQTLLSQILKKLKFPESSFLLRLISSVGGKIYIPATLIEKFLMGKMTEAEVIEDRVNEALSPLNDEEKVKNKTKLEEEQKNAGLKISL